MAVNIDSAKHELHHLVDQLASEQVNAALQYLHYLCADPVLLSLLSAPADNEPYTDAQRKCDAEAEAAIAGGDGIPHEEILREFGL